MLCTGENVIVSKRVACKLLALAVLDSVKTETTMSYPERNIMECSLVVIHLSLNTGKVINTRREVVEGVLLMNTGQLAYVQTRLRQLAYAYW